MTSGVYHCLSAATSALRRGVAWADLAPVLAEIPVECQHPADCRQEGGCQAVCRRWLRIEWQRAGCPK